MSTGGTLKTWVQTFAQLSNYLNVARRTNRKRGTTLVELLVSTAFLGVCAGVMLATISTAQLRATDAQDRLMALAAAENKIEQLKSDARTTALTPGTTSGAVALGIPAATSTMSTTTTLVGGYTDLYEVQVVVTWASDNNNVRKGTIKLVTQMRAPYD